MVEDLGSTVGAMTGALAMATAVVVLSVSGQKPRMEIVALGVAGGL